MTVAGITGIRERPVSHLLKTGFTEKLFMSILPDLVIRIIVSVQKKTVVRNQPQHPVIKLSLNIPCVSCTTGLQHSLVGKGSSLGCY